MIFAFDSLGWVGKVLEFFLLSTALDGRFGVDVGMSGELKLIDFGGFSTICAIICCAELLGKLD